jgi:branched-chain amino acid transport system ATP-binding protein
MRRRARRDAAPEGGATALEGASLSVHFEGLRAVDEVSIELRKGEILGLIGPNGAGKTTLVNALSGFQRPTAGRVLIDAQEISGWPAHRVARRGIARTFQSGLTFSRLSVAETVEVGAVGGSGGRRAAASLVQECLEVMGLDDRRDELANALTHGQERRLGIARALAMRPQFLLLDEPASGLDERESAELVETIAGITARSGAGILVIEHDMDVIMRLCERIQVLDAGKTIAVGTPDAIRRDPVVIEAYLGAESAHSHVAP